MKIRMLAAAAAVLMAATPVLAQPDRHDDHHDNSGPNNYGHDRHGPPGPPQGHNVHNNWRKGQRLPREYWGHDREVTDWHARHLRQPPRGYHWVRDDSGNYILAALAGGLIASIIAGNH